MGSPAVKDELRAKIASLQRAAGRARRGVRRQALRRGRPHTLGRLERREGRGREDARRARQSARRSSPRTPSAPRASSRARLLHRPARRHSRRRHLGPRHRQPLLRRPGSRVARAEGASTSRHRDGRVPAPAGRSSLRGSPGPPGGAALRRRRSATPTRWPATSSPPARPSTSGPSRSTLTGAPRSAPEEVALNRAMSLTLASGGAAVPYVLDPSVMPTSNGAVNPYR